MLSNKKEENSLLELIISRLKENNSRWHYGTAKTEEHWER
jgi:hypothetical protein